MKVKFKDIEIGQVFYFNHIILMKIRPIITKSGEVLTHVFLQSGNLGWFFDNDIIVEVTNGYFQVV